MLDHAMCHTQLHLHERERWAWLHVMDGRGREEARFRGKSQFAPRFPKVWENSQSSIADGGRKEEEEEQRVGRAEEEQHGKD